MNDTNGFSDVFVRDLVSGNISSPGIGDKPLGEAVISGDGKYVAYTKRTGQDRYSNFGSGDIYRYEIETGINELVSVGTNREASGWCSMPNTSPDGRYVAFQSQASNLVALGGSPRMQVYMRDMVWGSNVLVSVSTSGGFGDNDSRQPMFSPDGRWLIFRSRASNLIFPMGPPARPPRPPPATRPPAPSSRSRAAASRREAGRSRPAIPRPA